MQIKDSNLRLDMTEEIVRDAKGMTTASETDLNIKKITFEIPKESSKTIKFYKTNINSNYSNSSSAFTITRSE